METSNDPKKQSTNQSQMRLGSVACWHTAQPSFRKPLLKDFFPRLSGIIPPYREGLAFK